MVSAFIFRGPRNIPIKWRLGAAGATAVSDILRRFINTLVHHGWQRAVNHDARSRLC